ncbi:HPr family phosphocarrier protein [Domibacillus sp. DTU_2020_1001157_1_SI_ALB_TIR_016]|uniref:HPr family phosphocarrier protein n=1 Tax=Domibacillus sp. DTU_2020_1001157_1_SI_ALB_TIR_016 TaxID=3077789 RepID=UPI0028E9E6B0|nr:HPr family phosphocarrier protein [Domibacillus sp. DTU_2020_1001157_1_SI_ALB_TIR_016]WNS81369.1 HPr family phosphocarrier protein [Domibacillus sp. DTU_2020_1001157_1_SI_ALB_TIR_016]
MAEKTVHVQLKSGLQARPAALFVQEAARFHSEIFLEKDGRKYNAKSIMGIMSIALNTGEEVTISAEGRDSEEAVEKMASLIEREEWM